MAEMLEASFAGPLGAFTLDASFAFPASGVTALFGPSGCGKTTLLRCFAGLTRLPRGVFSIGGEVWQDGRTFRLPHERSVGYVFQDANLFAHLTVRGNLDYARKRARTGSAEPDFGALVDLLGLGPLLDRLPVRLSGGEKQRLAVARALLSRPQMLLMDEPLSALDLSSKREILPYLERVQRNLEIPVLYVTHAPDEVARLADYLVLVENGRVSAAGPLTETMARLDVPFADRENSGVAIKAVIGERDREWSLARADFDGGSLWLGDTGLSVGAEVRLMVRASDISLALEPVADSSILNRLDASVTSITRGDHPSIVFAGLDIGGTPLVARLTAKSAAHLGLNEGKSIVAQIKSAAILD